MNSKINNDLTIVCATHNGRYKLPGFIKSIEGNSLRPKEIIICGTSSNDLDDITEEQKNNNNIYFILSDISNQIIQRKAALKAVKTKYILQLDDDLILEKETIKNYSKHFIGPNTNNRVVSGFTIFPNGEHMSFRTSLKYHNSSLVRFYVFLINGFKKPKNMTILKSGRIFPYVFKSENNPAPNWLSSCIMYNKEVAKEYFEFTENLDFEHKEKAYFEDVLFTHDLFTKGYNLFIEKKAKLIHPVTSESNLEEFLKVLFIQKKIISKTNGSYILFIIDILASSTYYILKKIIKFKGSKNV